MQKTVNSDDGVRWIIDNGKSRRSKVAGCRRLEIQMDWPKMDYG